MIRLGGFAGAVISDVEIILPAVFSAVVCSLVRLRGLVNC